MCTALRSMIPMLPLRIWFSSALSTSLTTTLPIGTLGVRSRKAPYSLWTIHKVAAARLPLRRPRVSRWRLGFAPPLAAAYPRAIVKPRALSGALAYGRAQFLRYRSARHSLRFASLMALGDSRPRRVSSGGGRWRGRS